MRDTISVIGYMALITTLLYHLNGLDRHRGQFRLDRAHAEAKCFP